MKLTLECRGDLMSDILRALKASGWTDELLYLIFKDGLWIIRNAVPSFDAPISWVEIKLAIGEIFQNITLQSKKEDNLIVLQVQKSQMLEALSASSSFSNTQIIMRLTTYPGPQGNRIFLEFSCSTLQENEDFKFEKQVDVVVCKPFEGMFPEYPDTVQSELTCWSHLQQVLRPIKNDAGLINIGVQLEECKSCGGSESMEQIFACDHERRRKLSEECKLTVMSLTASTVNVTATYNRLPFVAGDSEMCVVHSSLKSKHLFELLHRAAVLSWQQFVLGIQHEGVVMLVTSKDDLLSFKTMAPVAESNV